MFLGKLNLLENKEFVCYPGVSSNIKGIYRPSLKAVTSLNLITSKSVGTILDFVEHIITYLESKSVFTQLKKNICV
jgi:4-methyl-5(b-hydroxyethyl)-thiazole monophosphate biosynthesis